MKNKIALFITLILLISCNKTEKKTTNNTETTKVDSLKINNAPSTKLIKMNEDQISSILAPKQNDTIYITNFFATWCKPCINEIPHFKEKMEELKNDKVKFTFVNVDFPEDWDTAVKKFADESNLHKNIILFNSMESITPNFFKKNFQTWDGTSIPFTQISKGDKKQEIIGMLTKKELTEKIDNLK